MKILVTGGAGFIGSEFVRQGIKKYDFGIVVIDVITYAGDLLRLKEVLDDVKFYKLDIKDFSSLKETLIRESPDVIVHFAAETHVDRSIENPEVFIETNVKGTLNLLEAVKNINIKLFINISTDEVYGELKESGNFSEKDILNPSSPYSVSKASSDMLGRAYFKTYGVPVITLRPSNAYGWWQHPEKFIPLSIVKGFYGEKIPVYGNGNNIREWTFVSDCVKAIYYVIEKGKIGDIYNIGSGEEKRNIDVVKTILSLLNRDESLIEFVEDRPGHDFRYSLDSGKIRSELGWKPDIGFEEGILKTVEWYIRNIDWAREKIKHLL